ncbi:DNA-3-methyladenine glycosylase 2 [Subtercola boreus]|uniref:DNA-3-methyladenine glycosylase II n=1 Tax=Subtercola boreus TaxID=120213 RepID=A0A3E0WCA7_9MICO|nr:AlkA N-terminal domain-containing protein [Subtercola boreus]RFA21224.1 hypothetical protein B7R24_07505 [Subtercola boreus]RFA21607.1 hypothetical protein B7R23_07450 [Subtercola boreus]RFA27576.1 hypothetical protein B7R25_07575 [Subtercola boreus]
MEPFTFTLPARQPFDHAGVTRFLAAHAVAGVEAVVDGEYWRTLALPGGGGVGGASGGGGGQAVLAVRADPAGVAGRVWLGGGGGGGGGTAERVVAAIRRLYDLDADAPAIDGALAVVPELGASLRAAPGIRMPGSTDAHETLFRTLLGQQVSVKAARTVQGRLAAALGDPLDEHLRAVAAGGPRSRAVGATDAGDDPRGATAVAARGGSGNPSAVPGDPAVLSGLFPTAEQIAVGGRGVVRGPAQRVETILRVAEALADGSLVIENTLTVPELTSRLMAVRGIGPWTADYVSMRVLGAPDVLLDGDLALRAGAAALGLPSDRRELVRYAERMAPWRSYFGMHLWRDAVAALAG